MRLGFHEKPYLLGIPQFESSSGKAGVVEQLDKYSIDLKDCIGTCYDTTYSILAISVEHIFDLRGGQTMPYLS